MKLPRRRFLHLAAVATALPAVTRIAMAQVYPARPVRFVVNLAPGGGLDFMARLIGEHLSRSMGQQVVIENKPGAGGMLGGTAGKGTEDQSRITYSEKSFALSRALVRRRGSLRRHSQQTQQWPRVMSSVSAEQERPLN